MSFFSRFGRSSSSAQGRVLATGTGPRAEVLAFADRFEVHLGEESPRVIGWHEVRTGGWKQEREELHWRLADGSKGAVQLTKPGQVPGVFRDRVQASIAVEDRFEVPGGGSVMISARRPLGDDHPTLQWSVSAVRGASLDDPSTKELADLALARLRADYDL